MTTSAIRVYKGDTGAESDVFAAGIDVGGTNTDACLVNLRTKQVLLSVKTATTPDVTSGIVDAIRQVLSAKKVDLVAVMIGTTTFVNAVVERSSRLARVAVLRLCGEATV